MSLTSIFQRAADLRRLLLLALLLALFSGPACAATLYLSPADAASAKDPRAVSLYESKGAYTMFLPSSADRTGLRVWLEGAEEAEIGGVTVHSGDLIALRDDSVRVRLDGHSFAMKVMQSSKLAAVYVLTESGSQTYIKKRKGNKEAGSVLIEDQDGEIECEQPLQYIRVRGNSSFQFVKKNYKIKLEKGKNLFDMGKCKTWVLMGNYRDKSFIRNMMTFDIARYARMPYTAQAVFCDLYINHEYGGLYMLGEDVRVDGARVDIRDLEEATQAVNDKPLETYKQDRSYMTSGNYRYVEIPNDPEDITGGYLIMQDYTLRASQYASAYFTKNKVFYAIRSPEYATRRQMQYISNFLQEAEDAIVSKSGCNPTTGKHYSEYFDLHSLTVKYMLEEISRNFDGNKSSQYFFKPSDSESAVAYAGPCWDYDTSYADYTPDRGNLDYLSPTGLFIAKTRSVSWWPWLYKHKDFQASVKREWTTLIRHAILILLGEETDPTGILPSLEEYYELLEDSAAMEYVRWPRVRNAKTVANTGYNLRENIDFLHDYLYKRMCYLDTQWGR